MSVKLFYKGEIRRFPMESLTNGVTFASLVQKVQQIYQNMDMKSVKFCWKDRDDDKITFKTDDELKEVLRNRVDDVLRVYIEDIDGANETEPVKMDASSVLETPTETPRQTSPPAQETVNPALHANVCCDGCNGSVVGVRYKCLICPDYDLCETCEGKRTHNQHPMVRIVSPQDNTWRRAFLPVPHLAHGTHHGMGRHCGRRHMRTAAGETAANASASAAAAATAVSANVTAGAQFLRNVGEAVAAALNGFGIDVDIDVEHDGQREKVTEPARPPAPANEETPEPTEPSVIPKSDTVENAAAGIRQMNINDSVYPKLDNVEQSPTDQTVQQGWTLIDKPDDQKEANNIPVLIPQPNLPSAPQVPQPVAAPIYHSNPHINAAVESMINMGFTNEGGWLTSLLIAKQGDISAVLDVLNQVKKF